MITGSFKNHGDWEKMIELARLERCQTRFSDEQGRAEDWRAPIQAPRPAPPPLMSIGLSSFRSYASVNTSAVFSHSHLFLLDCYYAFFSPHFFLVI